MIEINIAQQYTTTPGARYVSDGEYSGEDFRNKFLEPHFRDVRSHERIRVVLDGTEGFATSFLEEAFGGLARIYGETRCLERLEFLSKDDPLLVQEIQEYIRDAKARRKP